MKKNYLFFLLTLLTTIGYGQCIATYQYPTTPVTPLNNGYAENISTCNFGGDFAVLNGLIVGGDYEFTVNFAGYLTLTDTSNNVLASGPSPLIVNAITVANVRLHIHTNAACGTDGSCHISTVRCVSCAPPPPANDDCSSVTPTTLVNGAASTTFNGTTVGGTASAEETAILEGAMVWEAIELTAACSNVTLDYCGTASGIMDTAMVVYSDCLTEFTLGEWDFETCPDGNATVNFYNLPAGVYYLPVLSDFNSNTLGDYVMNVSSGDCLPAPDCAMAPIFPADGATDITADAPVMFTWTAPTTGETPTSYNLYAGFAPDALDLIDNTTETQYELTVGLFDTLVYWQVVPLNGISTAVGCPVWSFTTHPFEGHCLLAEFGQYPSATFTPTTCDGTTSNSIVTNGYASEYSLVNVTAGQTYQFTSSLPDLITISYDGTAVDAVGVSQVTWTAPTDGTVRFYTHLNDDNCGSETENREKAVLCGATLGLDSFDLHSLRIYPNPVSNILNISAQASIQNVSIYNMLGQEVLRTSPGAMEDSIDMSQFNGGTYFVKVTINDRTETVKLVKQ